MQRSLTDFELLNAYVRQQLIALDKNLKEELLMCRGGKADWNLAGQLLFSAYFQIK